MTKQLKTQIVLSFFFIAVIADLYGVTVGNGVLIFAAKPLLMTLLAVVYLVAVKRPNFWFVLGLFFSFLGDVFLLFKDSQFFIFGLLAFLLAHVVYIKITVGFLAEELTVKMISSSVPFLILFVSLLFLIKDNLGDMLLPVIVYGITISTFGAVALLNYRSTKSTSNLWLLLGAICFIVSDSLLAVNKFYQANHLYQILIMLTYILAQFLICKAMIAKNFSQE